MPHKWGGLLWPRFNLEELLELFLEEKGVFQVDKGDGMDKCMAG